MVPPRKECLKQFDLPHQQLHQEAHSIQILPRQQQHPQTIALYLIK
jgi:hypothetical protein